MIGYKNCSVCRKLLKLHKFTKHVDICTKCVILLEDKKARVRPKKDFAYRLICSMVMLVLRDNKKRGLGLFGKREIISFFPFEPHDLIHHIINQFDEHMSIDNYGTYWSVDHIIPRSRFNYNSMNSTSFRKCWELDNLRPLSVSENSKKGAM